MVRETAHVIGVVWLGCAGIATGVVVVDLVKRREPWYMWLCLPIAALLSPWIVVSAALEWHRGN